MTIRLSDSEVFWFSATVYDDGLSTCMVAISTFRNTYTMFHVKSWKSVSTNGWEPLSYAACKEPLSLTYTRNVQYGRQPHLVLQHHISSVP